MQNQRDSKIEPKNLQNLQPSPQQPIYNGQNFFQSSTIQFNSRFNTDTFPCISTIYFKDPSIDQSNPSLVLRLQSSQPQQYSYFQDQSQNHILLFGRGYSEEFQHFERQANIDCFKISEKPKINDVLFTNQGQCLQIRQEKVEIELDQLGQDLKSNSINSQSNINAQSSQSQQYYSTGILVKNVTKNMGKLLFKYIWKNRTSLKRVLNTDEETWEKLMSMIRKCKKQNNVTRQFLLSRFCCEGEQFKVFRVVAHHFFRKHCLAAIFRSKIKAKRIHFERIKKFDQALTNVRALDNLA